MALKIIRYIVIFTVGILLIHQIFVHSSELAKLPVLFLSANKPFILLAFLGYLLEYVADGLLSKILLQVVGYRLRLLNTLRIAIIDVFAAQILPFGEAGAVATSAYFYKKMGVTNKDIVFLSFFWAVLTSFALVLIGVLSLPFLPLHKAILLPQGNLILLWLIVFLVIAGIIISLFIFLFKNHLKKFIEKIEIIQTIKTYKKNIIANKSLMGISLICAFGYYTMQILILFASLAAFNIYPGVSVIIFSFTISLVITWISLIPGGVGVAEVSLSAFFLSFNLPASEVFAGVLLYRIFSFWIPLGLGGVTYFSLRGKPLR